MINSFKTHFIRLVSGTLAAHLVSALALLVISRIYSESQFDQLALFISLSGIAGAVFSLRMDLAVFSAESRQAGIITVQLGNLFIAGFVAISLIGVLLFHSAITDLYNLEIQVLILIPFAAGLLALYNLLANYNVSIEQTKSVAITKVVRTVTQSLGQILLSIFHLGLILGDVLGRVAGIFKLGNKYLETKRNFSIEKYSVREEVLSRKNFVTFSTAGTLFNTLVLYFPQLTVASLYSVGSAGALLLAQRLIAIPMVFIGQSMSQAYSVEFKKRIQQPKEQFFLFKKITNRLFLVSIVLFSFAAFISPYLVPFLLGEKWERVGTFIAILCPMFAGQIAITPVINTANILEKQKVLFLWDFFRLLFVSSILIATLNYNLSIENFLILFSFGMLFMYLVLYVYLFFMLRGRKDAISS